MLHPFSYDSITTKDLIDLQSDFGMKALFNETPYIKFWVHLLNGQNPEAYRQFLLFKCPQRIPAKVAFLVCVKSNLAKEIYSRTSIH